MFKQKERIIVQLKEVQKKSKKQIRCVKVKVNDKVMGFFVRKFYDSHMNLILYQIVSILDTMVPTCSLTILLIQISLIIEMIPIYMFS